jgi:hypothetical protein
MTPAVTAVFCALHWSRKLQLAWNQHDASTNFTQLHGQAK